MFTSKDIPNGGYCYVWLEVPSAKNNLRGKTKLCPFLKTREIDGVAFPWCEFLKLGGLPGSSGWKGWENDELAYSKLVNHFGSEEELNDKLPLRLLFDQVKECGENY